MTSISSSPRVLLIPSAGMGHLVPFSRLATALSDRNIAVSLLAVRPTVSTAESRLLSDLPPSLVHDFSLPQLDPSQFSQLADPFFLRMESIRRSVKHLSPLLSSFSAVVVDIFATSTFLPIAADANTPCFVLSTSSATMIALCASFRSYGDVDVAGVVKLPSFHLPGALRDPDHFFTKLLVENARALASSSGILMNTFDAFEPEIISALNSGKIVSGLPTVYAIGPLPPPKQKQFHTTSPALRWLDMQPERSVVYVCFGSRTTISADQMRELRAGLEMSGCRFLLVIKTAMVDREEAAADEAEMEELVCEGRGLVARVWQEQEAILSHKAVGGFLSHCGWNSVMEAAAAGARVLAWPRMGDQRVNAGVVKRRGLGLWTEEWLWQGDDGVVSAKEIGRKVGELMEDAEALENAGKIAAEAAEAVAEGGSSDISIRMFIKELL